jgi:hypothetical protein
LKNTPLPTQSKVYKRIESLYTKIGIDGAKIFDQSLYQIMKPRLESVLRMSELEGQQLRSTAEEFRGTRIFDFQL